MRLVSFSLWLGCIASSAIAFSTLPKPSTSTASTFGRVAPSTFATTTSASKKTQLGVASSTGPIAVAEMERGLGGRIEAAFEAAKEKGEAAFVTFITAGYPNADGTFVYIYAPKCIA